MKTKEILSAMLMALCVISSCQSEELIENETNSAGRATQMSQFTKDSLKITRLGYVINSIKELDSLYVVNDELLFGKSALTALPVAPDTKMNMDLSHRLDMDYQDICLSHSVEGVDMNYGYLVDEAANRWNNLENCNIHFNSSASTSCTIRFTAYLPNGAGNSMIYVYPLLGNYPATEVFIDIESSLWEMLPDDQRINAIMHALGHVVGLKDTGDGAVVENTMANDFGSIMKPHSGINSTNYYSYWPELGGFSSYDRLDIPKVYPLTPSAFSFGHPFSVNFTVLTRNYPWRFISSVECWKELPYTHYILKVDYLDSDDSDFTQESDTGIFDVTFPKLGQCKVIVTLNYDNYSNYAQENYLIHERSYNIVDNEADFPSSSEVEIGEYYDFKWNYSNNSYPDAAVTFSVAESLFDGGSDVSADIQVVTDKHVRIRFNEYGDYTVTARLVNGPSSGNVKTWRFRKLYKPTLSYGTYHEIVNQSLDAGPIQDLPELPLAESTSYPVTLTMGDEDVLSGRVFVRYALKYFHNTHYGDYGCVEHLLYTDHISHFKFNKGDSNVQELPPIPGRMNHPDSLNTADKWTVIYPFYYLEYPNDI